MPEVINAFIILIVLLKQQTLKIHFFKYPNYLIRSGTQHIMFQNIYFPLLIVKQIRKPKNWKNLWEELNQKGINRTAQMKAWHPYVQTCQKCVPIYNCNSFIKSLLQISIIPLPHVIVHFHSGRKQLDIAKSSAQ